MHSDVVLDAMSVIWYVTVCTNVIAHAKPTGVIPQNSQDSVLAAKERQKLQSIMDCSSTKNQLSISLVYK